MTTLYAKSRSDHGWPTLAEHSLAVCEVMRQLIGTPESPTRLATAFLRFFKLPDAEFGRVWQNVLVAGALHDAGKANDGFQSAVGNPEFRAPPKKDQAIRHEHLTALLLSHPSVRDWLTSNPLLDPMVIVSAVLTHHLKARRDGSTNEVGFACPVSDRPGCTIYPRPLGEVFDCAREYVGIPLPDLTDLETYWTFSAAIRDAGEKVKDDAHLFERRLRNDDSRRRLLLAVRAILIAADAAASALVREGRPITQWLNSAFGDACLTGEYVRSEIIGGRIAQLERLGRWDRNNGRDGWSDFQDEAANLGSRALLLAPCGAGKTLAAWRWIEAQLSKSPAARVLFLYPTRGTATEGFRDYVSWAPETDAALVSGTAAYDLEGLFENPADGDGGSRDPRAEKRFIGEAEARLFALAQWPKRVFSATVDTFLAFMANQYAPICLLPLLCDSVAVIDEVHSFSPAMFSALRQFLARFDVPVLCMTASLPPNRRRDLTDLGLQVFPRCKEQFADLQAFADRPRYRMYACTMEEAEHAVLEALAAGQKVLWVVNRVDECQRIFRRMAGDLRRGIDASVPHGISVLCYHSRFRLRDRRSRHNEVIRAFDRSSRHPVLAVTTQVCEMSLDLDADVLVTEVAPVTSMIQRMGRCCRQKHPGDRVGQVYVYEPESELPYEKQDIKDGLAFRSRMAAKTDSQPDIMAGAVSQTDLATELDAQATSIEVERYSAFWESGFWANAQDQPFREGEGYTIDCILQGDLDAYLDARREGRPETQGYIVPVPRVRSIAMSPDRRLRGLMVAPDHLYDESTGYCKPEVFDVQG